jgi:hypothetical protein
VNVKQLIQMLERCPSDMPVFVAYDSLVCIYDVTEEQTFIVRTPVENAYCEWPGIYICAMDDEAVNYHRLEENGEKVT